MSDRLEFETDCPNNHKDSDFQSGRIRKSVGVRRFAVSLQHMRHGLASI